MPTTQIQFPILQFFFCAVERETGMPPQPLDATPAQLAHAQKQDDGDKAKQLPKGVVLGPDGKPCRTCTSSRDWKAMMGQVKKQPNQAPNQPAMKAPLEPSPECPPDVEELGRSTWTLLHTMTANYPEKPSMMEQLEMKSFIGMFGRFYPCWVCADDFRAWMKAGNEPRVSNRDEFGRWMCEAHNAVNEKLGKDTFDCNKWQERWRTGWKDGSCD